MNRIDGILFDLGDTILDFGRVDIATLFESGARLTYQYLQDLGQPLPKFSIYHRHHLRAIRWNYFKSRITRREFNSLDIMGKLIINMGHNLTGAQMSELAWLWYQPLSRCATMEKGLVEMMREFRGQNLAMGLVSNTFVPGEVLDRQLAEAGLLDLLPTRVYSCEVGYRKPDRRIFAIALERAHLAADRTLFVGDLIKADVFGARRAGMISVLKDPHERHAGAQVRPQYSVKSLLELRQIVAKLNA